MVSVALAAFIAISLTSNPAESQSEAAGHSKWKLVWSDEFSGPGGNRPNGSKWSIDTGAEPKWGNQEWQRYTRRSKNVSTDGHGHLVITAWREHGKVPECPVGSCDITSGRIKTKGHFSQTYGRFEARIKLPAGQALWPAFWMMGVNINRVGWPDNGEIDVMEMIGSEPKRAYGTAHGPGFASPGIGGHTSLGHHRAITGHFHVFGINWEHKMITWTLDGDPYFKLRKSHLKKGQRWDFNHPHFMLLNLAVGGVWPGKPSKSTPLPARMIVDWVRVSKKRH